jgi:uncharacterized protein involved in response to NO
MERKYAGPVILSIGFRPFFVAAGVWAVVSVLAWIAGLAGHAGLPGHIAPGQWHYNELAFGVIGAAMTGFLFTAIPNWTGRLPIRGVPLLLLFGLWCLGRGASLAGESLGGGAIAVIDCAFFVAVFVLVLREILHGRNWRNSPVAGAVGLFALSHILFYIEALGVAGLGGAGQRLGLGVIAGLLALIGGRIVPSFTGNWLRRHGGADGVAAGLGPVDKAALLLSVAALLAWTIAPDSAAAGVALIAAGVLNGVRLARWRGLRTVSEPLLFVLHAGYAWLVAAFVLLGAAVLSDGLTQSDALHALTIGAAGTMVIAVMSRAILGHTGRPLRADRATTAAYCLVSLAALARLGAAVPSDAVPVLYDVSGIAWIAAFALFVWRYAPYAFRL